MKISLTQIKVARADRDANLAKGERLIAEAASEGSEIVCFPEMWTTGFDWEANARDSDRNEADIERVAAMAARYDIWVSGSMLSTGSAGGLTNSHYLFSPEGKAVGRYDKVHLFGQVGEGKHLDPGGSLCLVETPWGSIGLAVCYDLRFPELFRSYALDGAVAVICPAAFPSPKEEHWRVLSRARAIENQMFMVCVNQVGSEEFADGTSRYFGDSMIVDPWGGVVAQAPSGVEALITAEIDVSKVDEVRSHVDYRSDRRPDVYRPG